MAKKKDTPVRLDQLTEEEKMKYEIADELGLLDRVMKDGWKSLSSKETDKGCPSDILFLPCKGMEIIETERINQ